MNQILSVESPNSKKKKRSSIQSVIIVFAIILMIFGIGLTSSGAYSYYRSLSNNLNNSIVTEASTKPVISIERENASIINIVVTHDKGISNVTYTLNGNQPVQINGNNKTEIQEEISLPVGASTIVITAEDINGISSSYSTSFEVQQKPTITLEQVNTQIQITTKSEINIDYVMYYWDEDENTGEKITINNTEDVRLIDVLSGDHTLKIIAVDIDGNETIETKKIIGDTKPQVTVTTNGEIFNINTTDDQSLAKIEITLNDNETIVEEIVGTEYSTTINLENGENRLTVVVTNVNGLSETARVKYTKE